jgi:hypothetical protein
MAEEKDLWKRQVKRWLLMGWQVNEVMQWLMAEMVVTVCQPPHFGGQVGEQRW